MTEPYLCDHDWQPVSFVFETQMLDAQGRVRIRQPDMCEGRVYCVCMRCHHHTYIVTKWVGHYLVNEEDMDEEGNDKRVVAAWENRER